MKTEKPTFNIYEMISSKLLESLEQGVNPWQKTWQKIHDGSQPHNIESGHNYSGINLILLSLLSEGNSFITFKGIKKHGAHLRKGSKGFPIVFWNWFEKEDKDTKEKIKIPFLKYHKVYDSNDVEGLDKLKDKAAAKREEIRESVPHSTLSNYLEREKIALNHGGNAAYYSPSKDAVQMPHEQSFKDRNAYLATLSHEIVHSTGHKSRFDRFKAGDRFGSESYSFEELVAEIGACFLCGKMDIEPDFDNSASYLQGWSKQIKENDRWFVQAAGKAQKASDFVLTGEKLN